MIQDIEIAVGRRTSVVTAAAKLARMIILAGFALALGGCATKKKPEYGFSHPQPDTADRDFFFGSFFRDSR